MQNIILIVDVETGDSGTHPHSYIIASHIWDRTMLQGHGAINIYGLIYVDFYRVVYCIVKISYQN